MKRILHRTLSLVFPLALIPGTAAIAANQTWNPGGAGGGTGSWSAANWDSASGWSANSTAVFGGSPGAVTLNGTTQAVGGLAFNVGGYALSGGTLALNGAPTTIVTNGGTTSFSSNLTLSGAAGSQITKTGAGTLALSAASGALGTAASNAVWTVTGGTLSNGVYDSVLSVTGGNNLGAAPATGAVQAILDAGTLIATGNSAAARWIQVNAAGGTIEINTTNSVDGKIINNADASHSLYVGAGAGFTGSFTGAISGNGSLAKIDSGNITLSGANTYTGGTTVSAGLLKLGNATALGAVTGALAINGGTLDLGGNSQGAGNFSGSGGTVLNSGNGTNAALTIGNGNASGGNYAGVIADNGGGGATGTVSLVKTGTGTLTLSGSNSFTGGTVIQAGALQLAGGNNRLAAGGTVVLGGNSTSGKLVLGDSSGASDQTVAGLAKTGAGGSVVGGSAANSTLTVNVASGTDAFGGMLGGNGTNENNLALVKTGAGALTLAAGNTFAGGVTIGAGTLGIVEGNSLGATAPMTVFSGNSTLRFEQTPSGNVSNLRRFGISSGVVATIDTQTYNATIDSAISGNGSLAKAGSGTLTLSANNTFIGGATVSAGTLRLTNAGALGNGSITLAAGSALQAGLNGTVANAVQLASGSETVDTAGNTLTLSGVVSGNGSLVKSGSGTLILGYNSVPNTFSGGVTLNGGTLGIYQGNSLGALPGSPATQLTFAGNSTLQFEVANPTALNANRQFAIGSGVTATIDTQAFSVTINGAIGGSVGSLAKTGSGTLTLNGNNTYGGGTTIAAGTLKLGNANAMGTSAASLAINGGTLDLNGFSKAVGTFSSQGGAVVGINLGATLAAATASVSGTTYIGINPASISSPGTFNLITSAGGGLAGTYQFSGAQDLAVPVNSLIVKAGSNTFYRVTLSNSGTAEQVVVSADAPSRVLGIMPLGASITAGYSGQTGYNGGGYRTQLYQSLVNDGRFTPNFVGSSSTYPDNLLTTAGEGSHEGHYGYTTSHILDNLNANDGYAGNNGGFWLAPGNGVNPDYVPLNVGGNDFGINHTDTQAINRFDAIISKVGELRSGTTTIATTLMYRSDVGTYENTYFNPYLAGVVYNHTLAGENVRFLDLYSLITPGNSLANISSDGIHPTQAGYNLIADAIYHSVAYGGAYWTGAQGNVWGTVTGGNATNWAMDPSRTTDRQAALDAGTDAVFNNNASALAVSLPENSSVRSLNFAAGATGDISISGNGILTIGSGGITVQQGTGAHAVAAGITLGADQTWGNVSSHNLTVSGAVSGQGNLTVVGAYSTYAGDTSTSIAQQTGSGTGAIVLSGNNTYTGTTSVTSGTLIINGTSSGNGGLTVADGATFGRTAASPLSLGGNTTFSSGSKIELTLGNGTNSSLNRTSGTWSFALNEAFVFDLTNAVAGTTYHILTGLAAAPTIGSWTWSSNMAGATGTFSNISTTGVDFNLTTVPEPSTWALMAFSLTVVIVMRRRRNS